jgi:hypothetical protein
MLLLLLQTHALRLERRPEACMCVCVHVRMYVCMHVCVCVWTCMYVFLYVHQHVCMYLYRHIYMCIYTCICMCVYIYIYICIYIYIYIYESTCIRHTDMHTCGHMHISEARISFSVRCNKPGSGLNDIRISLKELFSRYSDSCTRVPLDPCLRLNMPRK